MRSHAKASSAAPTQRQATGLGRFVRGAFAGRGASGDVGGSGAPSAGRLGLIAFAIALVGLIALAPAALASKNVIRSLGAGGSLGGRLESPRGVAVNSTGAGGVSAGDFYVADRSNNRIQQFHSDGQFVRAWGQDVVGINESQQLMESSNASAGTFTLTFEGQTTAPLSAQSSAISVRLALEALSTIGSGNVTVDFLGAGFPETPYTVTFTGALEGTDLPQLTIDDSHLEGPNETSATVTVETLADGFGGVGSKGFEICEEAEHCKAGITSVSPAPGGEMSLPQGIAVDQSTGAVYVTDRNFLRVQKFSATGEFQAAFGKDVKTGGVTTTEVCTVASECKTGVTGEAGGEFKSNFEGYLAVAPPGSPSEGNVYVADPANRRVQQFDSNGGFVNAFGWDGVKPGGAGASNLNEQQTVTLAAGVGSFTLGFTGSAPTTTSAIQAGATAGEVEAALAALGGIASEANVDVSGSAGGPWTVEFTGALADRDVSQLTITPLTAALGAQLECTSSTTAETTSYQWIRNGTPITGATEPTYEPNASSTTTPATTTGDEGSAIQCVSTKLNANAGSVQASNPALVVAPFSTAPPVKSSTFTISGTVAEGNNLTCPTSGWTGSPSFAFQWYRNGQPIAAATAETYAVTAGDVASAAVFQCAVSATNAGGTVVRFSQNRATSPAPSEPTAPGGTSGAPAVNAALPSGSGVLTTQQGSAAFEVCSVAADCQRALSGQENGQFANNSPERVAVDDAGRIYVIDNNNSRVQRFSAAAAFDTLYGTTELSGSPAPTDIAIDPGATSAGDASDDHVFVVKPNSSPSERRIKELGTEADPALIDTHMVGAGITSVNGLGLNIATGPMFVSTGQRILTIDDALPNPTVVLKAITTKTDTTATLKATIDPMGGDVNCKYEYSTDEEAWTELAEGDCATLANEGGAQAVSEPLAELIPNQLYFVRLVVSRPWPPTSIATSDIRVFNTDAVPPVVSDLGSIPVSKSSERLVITIDAKHSPTSYVFQYGTTPSLGSQTAPLAIGSANEALTFSQVVTGLSPDTTYYYRAVATNPTGPTNSPVGTFHTRATDPPAADQRGYEMVSPPDKNNGDVDSIQANFTHVQAAVSTDGNAAAFCTLSTFGEPPAGITVPNCAGYNSRRTSQGWQTKAPFPRYCHIDLESGSPQTPLQLALNPTMDQGVLLRFEPKGCNIPALDPSAPSDSVGLFQANLYRSDLSSDASDPSSYQLITPAVPYGYSYLAGSSDFSHVVFRSINNQTESPDSPAPGEFMKLYDWHEGNLTLVTKDPGGIPFTTPSTLAKVPRVTSGSEYGSAISTEAEAAVSQTGDRIFFQNPTENTSGLCQETNCRLFLREDASTTYEVSESECTVQCDSEQSAAQFDGATPDGRVAFFASCAKLTNESAAGKTCKEALPTPDFFPGKLLASFEGGQGGKLYRWDVSAPPGARLIDLTVDHEPADGVEPSAIGVTGVSEDGEVVYFATGGQIIAGAPIRRGGKLYRWNWNDGSPTVEYLTTIEPRFIEHSNGSGSDARNEESSVAEAVQLPYNRITPDGKYLVILTNTRIDPAIDRDETNDIYRWSKEEGWLCVSCQEPGTPSAGPAGLGQETNMNTGAYGPLEVGSSLKTNYMSPFISDNGRRIVFDTPDALVPEDVNGEAGCTRFDYPKHHVFTCGDIYEWHDGRVSLLSSGTAPEGSYLVGIDHSGHNALFITRQQLVGWDVDQNTDIYDARIGGGFPEPPPQPAGCEGEACRGATTSAPSGQGAGTAVFQGPGNPTPKHAKARKKKKHKKRRHRKHRRGSKRRKAKRHANRTAKHNRRAAR